MPVPHDDTAAKLEAVRLKIKRWQSRAKRAMTMLDKLTRQQRRLEAKLQQPVNARPQTVAEAKAEHKEAKTTPVVDLDIPPFLKRTTAGDVKDAEVVAKLQAEAETKKKLKAQGGVARRKAKLAGETKKMPLTGKAAMAFIDQK